VASHSNDAAPRREGAGEWVDRRTGFNACLAARGYYRVADTPDLAVFQQPGNFYVPASAMLQCAN